MKTNKKMVQKLMTHPYFLRIDNLKTRSKEAKANTGFRKILKEVTNDSSHSYDTRLNVLNSPITLCKTKSFSNHRIRGRPTEKLKTKGDLNHNHPGTFSLSTKVHDFNSIQTSKCASNSDNKEHINKREKAPRYVTRSQFLKLKEKFPSMKRRIMNAFKEDKLSKLNRKNNWKSFPHKRYMTRLWLRIFNQLYCKGKSQQTSSTVHENDNNIDGVSNLQLSGIKPKVNDNLINENTSISADEEAVVTDEAHMAHYDKTSDGNPSNAEDDINSQDIRDGDDHSKLTFSNYQNWERPSPIIVEKTMNQIPEIKTVVSSQNISCLVSHFENNDSYVDSECPNDHLYQERYETTEEVTKAFSNEKVFQMAQNQKKRFLSGIEEVADVNVTAKAVKDSSEDDAISSSQNPIPFISLVGIEYEEETNKLQKSISNSQNTQQLIELESRANENCNAVKQVEEVAISLTTSISLTETGSLKSCETDSTTANHDFSEDIDEERSMTPILQNLTEDSFNEIMDGFRCVRVHPFHSTNIELSQIQTTPIESENLIQINSNSGNNKFALERSPSSNGVKTFAILEGRLKHYRF